MGKGKTLLACLCLITVGLLFFGSVPVFSNANSSGAGKSTLKEAREGLEKKLAGSEGFAGIAHLEDEGTIIVFLENEQAKAKVPDSFSGFSVRKEVTGKFKAVGTLVREEAPVLELLKPISPPKVTRTGVVRPLIGGVSVSALAVTSYIYAGTLGMVTYENLILSNAHVIAMNIDTGDDLKVGTRIVQPGTLDGWPSTDTVGALRKFIPIKFGGTEKNYADAAVANIDPGVSTTSGVQFSEKGNYRVSGTTQVSINNRVRKSGRTSGVTTNSVILTNASVSVDYTAPLALSPQVAYFEDQIFVKQPFIKSGDSGSCVDKDGKFVGLAFAASNTYAVVCKASYIITGLNISVGP